MAAHARLNNEFTEDEKYHNLMSGFKYLTLNKRVHFDIAHNIVKQNEPRHEKTCLRVCDQVRLKPACSAKEAS